MSDARALWAHTFGFQSDHDAKAAFGAGFLRLELISVRTFVLSGAPERIKHLASVPGGLVEREPALGRRVNLDATINVFERLAASRQRPRVVFASSVAVYGDMDGRPIGSDSPTRPTITSGAHKRMAEIALADFSRRRDVSGIALRLPGLIARPGPATGFGSAFMSEAPRAYAAGKPYVWPVSPRATA